MRNYLKKIALTGMAMLAAGSYTGGNFISSDLSNKEAKYKEYENSRLEKLLKEHRENLFNQKVEEQSSDEIKVPYYKLSPNSCSKYARLSANKIFDKKYNPGHAWDLKYDNSIVYQFKEEETTNDSTIYENLKNKIVDGTLEPGMMIITKRDMGPKEYRKYKSYGTPGKDEMGNKIEETHVILYLGINDQKQPEFLHQWINQREKITIEDFKARKNLKPTIILDTPYNKAMNEIDSLKVGKAESQFIANYGDNPSKDLARLATKRLSN